MRMRRPGTLGGALARARGLLRRRLPLRAARLRRAGRREPFLDRVEPPVERAQLLVEVVELVVRDGPCAAHALAHLLGARLRALDEVVNRPLCAAARLLRRPDRRLDRALDGVPHRGGYGWRSGPALGHALIILPYRPQAVTAPDPIHLNPATEVAERVLLPGDPQRALAVSQALLEGPKMMNARGGLWGYTGTAPDGGLVTVQSTGMGGPRAAIVAEELIGLGARVLLRIGTCGALTEELELGELLAVEAALCEDGTSSALGAGARAEPDAELTRRLGPAATPAIVVSTDVFYETRDGIQ